MDSSHSMLNDFRFAIRTLLKAPGFTLAAILALGLGIGVNTTVFSLANAILLRPLPYPDAGQLVMIREINPKRGWEAAPAAHGNFADWRDRQTTFSVMGVCRGSSFQVTGGERPEKIPAATVSPGYLHLFGVAPMLGRDFEEREFIPGNDKVVILTHKVWLSRFGGSRDAIGKNMRINDQNYQVVGVMPPGFETPHVHDIWAPLALDARAAANRERRAYWTFGRLKPGANVKQAQAELSGIARQAEQSFPETNAGFGVDVKPLVEAVAGSMRPAILMLLGAVAMVLLIACANIANLQLARASARTKEIAIRSALGASPGRIIRQMLAESTVLALAGGALGLALAAATVQTLARMHAAQAIPRLVETNIDARVLGFTLLISLATGMLFGLAPALHTGKLNLNDILKQGGRAGASGGNRFRNLLVIGEITLAVVLLTVAGLFVKSFLTLSNVNPGFQPSSVLLADAVLPRSRYNEPAKQEMAYRRMVERLAQLPGVTAAAGATTVPFGKNDIMVNYWATAQVKPAPGEIPSANYYGVTPDYFRALGIPLRGGRLFTERDGEAGPPVAIVNQWLAKRLWPNQDAVGQYITLDHTDPTPRQIVGVIGNIKRYGLDKESTAEVYEPFRQRPYLSMVFVLKTTVPPHSLAIAAARAAQEIEPDAPVQNFRTMDHQIDDTIMARRFAMALVVAFAVLALALAALGVYGVISYSVSRRTQEMGIRMALGAQPGDILKLVLRQGLSLAGAGLAAGLAVSLAFGRFISSQLYQVKAADAAVSGAVIGALLLVAVLAVLIPARRAMRVDPIVALRYD